MEKVKWTASKRGKYFKNASSEYINWINVQFQVVIVS